MALTEQEAESLYREEFGEEVPFEGESFAAVDEEEADLASGLLQEDDDNPFEREVAAAPGSIFHPHEHREGFENEADSL